MIEHPRAIRLWVADLELAERWYSQALQMEPVLVDAHSVNYAVGFCTLMLRRGPVTENTGASVYWGVDDVPAHYRRIGALAHTGKPAGPQASMAPGAAELLDPFGNVFGLTAHVTHADQLARIQREAQKAALQNVRHTVDQFRQDEEAESKNSRRVFAWAALALAVLVAITWSVAYVRTPTKATDVRSTFGAPAK